MYLTELGEGYMAYVIVGVKEHTLVSLKMVFIFNTMEKIIEISRV